jgi:hypothetical protein
MENRKNELIKEMLFTVMQCDNSDRKLFDVFMNKFLESNIKINDLIEKSYKYISRDLDLYCFCEALAEFLGEDSDDWE